MAHAYSGEMGGTPVGAASDQEPPNTVPGEPSNVTGQPGAAKLAPAQQGDAGTKAAAPPDGTKAPGNEEPEPSSETDVPVDGRDEVGEKMIRDLPVAPGLERPDDNVDTRSR